MFNDSRADIAVMLTSPTQHSEKVATVPLEWLGSPGAPVDRLVLFERPCAVRHQAIASLPSAARFDVVKECSSLSAVVSAVRRGEGITPLARIGAKPDGLDQVRSLPQIPPVPLFLATGPRIPPEVHLAIKQRARRALASAISPK